MRPDGTVREVADSATASFLPGRHLSILRDVTDRKRAEAELEQRAREQAAVAALGERALERMDVSKLMREAVSVVAKTLNVEYCELLELLPERDALLLRAGSGWRAGLIGRAKMRAGAGSQAGFTLSSAGPVVSEDLRSESRFAPSQLLRDHGVVSGMTVVVKGQDSPFGVLGAHSAQRREFTADHANFLQALANVLANAIERQGSEEAIRHQALHDPLTGLPNRTLFLDRLEQALELSKRSGSTVAAIFIDLDHFKAVNDTLGHDWGDQLLVALAPRLRGALRPSDTVARFGGDEFVGLCQNLTSDRDAVALAQRIADVLAEPFVLGDEQHFATASIGVAVGSHGNREAEELINDADAAMYRAKERGGGRYELFDEATRAPALERLRLENALRGAIEREELALRYQPLVSLSDGDVKGLEALLRWHHPDLGSVPPSVFIPLAEESRMIVRLGRWVLEEACRQAARWRDAYPDRPLPPVSVNLSVRQVLHGDLPEMVLQVLEETAISPEQLRFEITESLLLEQNGSPTDVLRTLKALGISIMLDDFGTGYSALSYLKRVPLDFLKIDQSFVAGLGRESEDQAIVAAILGVSEGVGLGAVAEGVETEQQLSHLQDLGCEAAQGYYFSPPLAPEELEGVLTGPPPWQVRLPG